MLRSVNLENFRNHHLKSFEFSPTTVIIGPNGSGKTNLLESVFVSSLTKSWRAPDHSLLRSGHQYYRIEAEYDDGLTAIGYRELPTGKTKQAFVGDKKAGLNHIVGRHPVILFEPNQTQIFAESPGLRRRYLDTYLSQIDPQYLAHIRRYRRLIQQRNQLLEKSFEQDVTEQLMIFTIQLIDPATYIVSSRQKFLQAITQDINLLYNQLTQGKSSLELQYSASLDIGADIGQQYELQSLREKRARRTLLGPHRDDFGVNIDDQAVQNVSSRGELRALILALKYAEFQHLKQSTDSIPLLLFDDVLSEFDSERRRRLLNTDFDGQLIMTTTEFPKNMEHVGVIEL